MGQFEICLLTGSGWGMAEESAETLPRFSQLDTDQNGGLCGTGLASPRPETW